MKTCLFLLLAALVAGSALPVLAKPNPFGSQDAMSQAEADRERSTEAYRDGYRHGQDDARAGLRNDSPGDRWTLLEDRTAWRDGYSAGFQQVRTGSIEAPVAPGSALTSDPARFGYDDGLAQGRKDREKGEKFRPTDSHFYKDGNHGWSDTYSSDKDHYKQVYCEAYTKGYQEGYNGDITH